jgi:hypothetical protein
VSDAERELERRDEHQVTPAFVSAVSALVVAWEVLRYREDRVRVRHPELAA